MFSAGLRPGKLRRVVAASSAAVVFTGVGIGWAAQSVTAHYGDSESTKPNAGEDNNNGE